MEIDMSGPEKIQTKTTPDEPRPDETVKPQNQDVADDELSIDELEEAQGGTGGYQPPGDPNAGC